MDPITKATLPSLISRADVRRFFTTASDRTLHRWIHDGAFPAPAKKRGHIRYWRLSDVLAWDKQGEPTAVQEPAATSTRAAA